MLQHEWSKQVAAVVCSFDFAGKELEIMTIELYPLRAATLA
jgi:hypothetical protein